MVVIFLLFHGSILLISLFKNLVIALLLMLPMLGMLFLVTFVHPPSKPLSGSSLKPTCTPMHTHLSLYHPLAFSVVLNLFSVPGSEIGAVLMLLRP